jgi:hypothetical protein
MEFQPTAVEAPTESRETSERKLVARRARIRADVAAGHTNMQFARIGSK